MSLIIATVLISVLFRYGVKYIEMYLNTNTFGQIQMRSFVNVFKYEYFRMYLKEQIHCFSFAFYSDTHITSQHQLDLSHQFMNFLLITPEEHKMFKILISQMRKDERCSLDLLTRCFILSFDIF